MRSDKKSYHSPRKQHDTSIRSERNASIRHQSPPVKQIETKQISLETSTSSVESFSKKLEKSAVMSPEESDVQVQESKSNNNTSVSEKQAPPVKRRETTTTAAESNIVIRKQTYSSSSEDDEDFWRVFFFDRYFLQLDEF